MATDPNRIWESPNGLWMISVHSLQTSTVGGSDVLASVIVNGPDTISNVSIDTTGRIRDTGMGEIPAYVMKAAERFLRGNYDRIKEIDDNLAALAESMESRRKADMQSSTRDSGRFARRRTARAAKGGA